MHFSLSKCQIFKEPPAIKYFESSVNNNESTLDPGI